MIVGEFPPNCGGIGIYVYNLSKKLIERGHNVTVLTRGYWKNKCIQENVDGINVYKIFHAPIYPFHVKFHGFFLKNQFKLLKNEFEIVHVHSPLIPSFDTDLPIISTIHGIIKRDIGNKGSKDLNSIFTKFFSKTLISWEFKSIKNSDMITTVSNSCTDEINDIYNLGDKVVTVNNGVDTNFFVPKTTNDVNSSYILYAGRLDSRKGLIDLIMAAKYVCKEHSDIKFILVGNGSLEKYLKQKVNKLGLKKNFNFVGFVSNTKILEYYQNSTVYVNPSYYEGLPTTLLEAMACEIASVATNVEGNSELINDGETGLLVPPQNPKILSAAIINLLDDEKLRQKLGKNARQHIVNNYDWEIITDNLEQLYRSLSSKLNI